MFEFLPVGLAVCVAGILYMTFVGHRLLPETREADSRRSTSIREYLSEVVVTPGSPLAGQALRDTPSGADGPPGAGDPARRPAALDPEPYVQLQEGDLLIVQASREGLLQVKDTAGIEIRSDLKLEGVQDLTSETIGDRRGPADAAVGPASAGRSRSSTSGAASA